MSCNTYYDIMYITSTPRGNQPDGKTHSTEKPGKNVVDTSNNGPSPNRFKITSWMFNRLKPNTKLETDYIFID